MKLTLYLLLLLLVIFSACSGKRYGHYSYAKKNNKKENTVKQKKKLSVVTLNQQTPKKELNVLGIRHNDTILSVLKNIEQSKTQPRPVKYRLTEKGKHQVINNKNNVAVSDTVSGIKPQANSYANASMVFGIISLFFALFSILYLSLLILAFGFGLAAFYFGDKALQEIKKSPNLYSNKGAAKVGRTIGIIYVVALLITLLVILLYVLVLIILVAGFILSLLLI